jgi:hypothetical protein
MKILVSIEINRSTNIGYISTYDNSIESFSIDGLIIQEKEGKEFIELFVARILNDSYWIILPNDSFVKVKK